MSFRREIVLIFSVHGTGSHWHVQDFFFVGGARSLKTLFLKIFMSKKLYSRPNKIPKFSKSMLGIETD